ncbi:hypothetical protein [Robinsoniella peoriensis]|uniref:hypothetical protein n=1 Tax=Robinsoniella peoriensis TaxID=180332 RepID=UPI001364A155|nr:hypothetical protein [Robinsoniella peoriensis]
MEVVREKMGVGNWHGLRQLAAELVFSAESRPRGCDQLFVFGFSRVCCGSSV